MAKCSQTILEGSPDQTLTEEQKHGQCDICSYLIGTYFSLVTIVLQLFSRIRDKFSSSTFYFSALEHIVLLLCCTASRTRIFCKIGCQDKLKLDPASTGQVVSQKLVG
jgi:hypothetical protein